MAPGRCHVTSCDGGNQTIRQKCISEIMAEITHSIVGNVLVVTFHDSELFDRLVQPCNEILECSFSSGVYNVVLDFTSAQVMDSLFLGMLARIYRDVNTHGGKIKLVGVSDRLDEILERVRFRNLFQYFDNVGEAVESFKTEFYDTPS